MYIKCFIFYVILCFIFLKYFSDEWKIKMQLFLVTENKLQVVIK